MMIRITTFAILAIVVWWGIGLLVPAYILASILPYGLLLVAWIAIFDVCERGQFASYLRNLDAEAKQLSWPNRVQMLHSAMVVTLLMTVMCIGSLASTP